MPCAWESESSKGWVGRVCNKGHTFCLEEKCPDWKPIDCDYEEG
jgi:hypothetical protein